MSWLMRHLQVLVSVIGQLSRNWVNTLLAALVIGIALALPAGLYLALHGLDQATANWDGTPQISLFLKDNTSKAVADKLVSELEDWPEVGSAHYISPDQALEEFRDKSGFGAALELLDKNPLPGVIVILPNPANLEASKFQELAEKAGKRSEVEQAQLDLEWVRRLYTLLQLGDRATLLLGTLLGLGVILITGNTIRLAIFSRKEEIEISKLIGATNAFIRRPFIYFGLLQGVFGGLVALILIRTSIRLLQNPIQELVQLYSAFSESAQSGFGPGLGLELLLIIVGGLLGLGGSWLAVGRHLKEIEPH